MMRAIAPESSVQLRSRPAAGFRHQSQLRRRIGITQPNAGDRQYVVMHSWLSQLLKPSINQEEDKSSNGGLALLTRKQEAKQVMIRFYDAWNAGDLEALGQLLADDIEYHDMALYQDPFKGKEEVLKFLGKVRSKVPADLKFVIDDISGGDPYKVGIMWHVELADNVQFPFSRGCSFCTVNDKGQVTQVRDLVEVPNKPGDAGLSILGALAPLVRKLGPNADPAALSKLPLEAAAVWAFYIGYSSYIMFSNTAPGSNVFAQPPEVLQEILYESLNFFYINIGLDQLGLAPVPSIPCPPVSEALFNFVAAWGLMFLPVILTEERSKKVGNSWAWFTGIMFLTNVFFIPFLALRAAQTPGQAEEKAEQQASEQPTTKTAGYPSWTPVTAGVGLAVGLFSVWWALEGRPEYGDLAARAAYFQETFNSNRPFFAFVVDAGLYAVWQAILLDGVPGAKPAEKYIPFFGLAAHLFRVNSSNDKKASA